MLNDQYSLCQKLYVSRGSTHSLPRSAFWKRASFPLSEMFPLVIGEVAQRVWEAAQRESKWGMGALI